MFADVLVRPEDQYTSSSISYYAGTTALRRSFSERCQKELASVVYRMAKNPCHSVSRLFADPYTVKAAYILFDRVIPRIRRIPTPRTVPRNASHYRFVVGPCSSWAILISRPTRYSASSRVVPICTSFSIRGP
jgi:hypothetical protein